MPFKHETTILHLSPPRLAHLQQYSGYGDGLPSDIMLQQIAGASHMCISIRHVSRAHPQAEG